MLPQFCATLLALLPDVTYWTGVYAADSFLSDTLIRKDQVQTVLEYQPAKHPGCDNIVSPSHSAGPIQI